MHRCAGQAVSSDAKEGCFVLLIWQFTICGKFCATLPVLMAPGAYAPLRKAEPDNTNIIEPGKTFRMVQSVSLCYVGMHGEVRSRNKLTSTAAVQNQIQTADC